jgi:hypothetical protein
VFDAYDFDCNAIGVDDLLVEVAGDGTIGRFGRLLRLALWRVCRGCWAGAWRYGARGCTASQ